MEVKKLTLDDRSGYKLNLLSNLNYYGNLDTKIFGKPVKKVVSSDSYEKLMCVSYNPRAKELRATVKIKNQSGYLGNHCQQGSFEYVRFYIDYENNGTWEDLGVTSFKIHDIEDHKGLCYGVKLKIKPSVTRKCNSKPVLPNVRAILSWNIEPPANTPNHNPVWGNVVEARIQIAPKPTFFPIDFDFNLINSKKLVLDTLNLTSLEMPSTNINFKELKANYKKNHNEVDDARLISMNLKELGVNYSLEDLLVYKNKLDISKINISKSLEILKKPSFNTTYEELKCVALNRKLNEVHADILVKKTSGYSGNLCSKGSNEYVSFYMDFGSGWEFMGTSSVKVHDINNMPKEGLWYNAYLPVNLTEKQKQYCQEGKAKLKGILSWNVAPTPNNPNYVATWGDWEICDVEIKPLPQNVPNLNNQPWLESIGGVDVDIIDSVTGLAKGPSGMGNGIIANYSPFDGNIFITGMLLNQIPVSKYKVMIKEPEQGFLPLNSSFNVSVTTFNTILGTINSTIVNQSPTGDYYDYLPKPSGVIQKHVNDDILALFRPTKAGLHEIYIESNTGQTSETITFMVDKDTPEVAIDITTGTGNCGKFNIGDKIKGNFSAKDERHLQRVYLSLAPHGNEALETSSINSFGDPIISLPGSKSIVIADTTSDYDKVIGNWEIDTSNLPACGYTIHVRAVDRTIVNSSYIGKYSSNVSKGFCLE